MFYVCFICFKKHILTNLGIFHEKRSLFLKYFCARECPGYKLTYEGGMCCLILQRIFLVYLHSVCPHSLMDRIQDSGSYDCSSILHGGTKRGSVNALPLYIFRATWWHCKGYRFGIRTPTTRKIVMMSLRGTSKSGKSC